MDFQSVYLSPGELRRFLEIARGDSTAANTPDEDALFRNGLIRENMLVKFNENYEASIDLRAVVLTDFGNSFYAWYMNERDRRRRDTLRFWITVVIGVVGALATVISIMR